MTENSHLTFLFEIGKEKFYYQNNSDKCPFCNRDELSEILDEKDNIILVTNKFPTLADTYQTVLIETDDCSANITYYNKTHLRKIITFGINHWLRMEKTGDYKSVVFYKNHGNLSGGSISHPHMQIVGLKKIDYKLNLKDDIFEGVEIFKAADNIVNISTKPNACATEFNIITTPRDDNFLADNIQIIIKYIVNQIKCKSYNIFFYEWKKSIICKILPRFVTSPFLLGFSIPQTSNMINDIAEQIREIYY